jgi:hypothetical protein
MKTVLLINICDGPLDESTILDQIKMDDGFVNPQPHFVIGQNIRLHSDRVDIGTDKITNYKIFKIDYDLGIKPIYGKLCINIYICKTWN